MFLLILLSPCEIFAGAIYVWSAFASLLRDEFNLTYDIANTIFSLSHISFSLGMMGGGLLANKKYSLDRILFFTSILHLLSFIFSSLANNTWMFTFFYGIIFGLACGIINSSIISTIIRHSSGAHGRASGIILTSFGLSPFILTPIVGFMNSIMGWRGAFMIIGMLGFAVLFSVALILRTQDFLKEKDPSENEKEKNKEVFSARLRRISSLRFWIVEAWYVPLLSSGVAILGNLVQFLTENNIPHWIALLCLSIYGLTNAFGRSLFGYIHDTLYGKRDNFHELLRHSWSSSYRITKRKNWKLRLKHMLPLNKLRFFMLNLQSQNLNSCWDNEYLSISSIQAMIIPSSSAGLETTRDAAQ
ncbi:MAG: MFS transporter [Candidatus Bathyarchaeia archaeon]